MHAYYRVAFYNIGATTPTVTLHNTLQEAVAAAIQPRIKQPHRGYEVYITLERENQHSKQIAEAYTVNTDHNRLCTMADYMQYKRVEWEIRLGYGEWVRMPTHEQAINYIRTH